MWGGGGPGVATGEYGWGRMLIPFFFHVLFFTFLLIVL